MTDWTVLAYTPPAIALPDQPTLCRWGDPPCQLPPTSHLIGHELTLGGNSKVEYWVCEKHRAEIQGETEPAAPVEIPGPSSTATTGSPSTTATVTATPGSPIDTSAGVAFASAKGAPSGSLTEAFGELDAAMEQLDEAVQKARDAIDKIDALTQAK